MQIKVGDIVEGKITGIKEYGVFADIGDGKSGMVHISEVSQTFVNDINEHIKVGDVHKMKVLNVTDDGKISLSIKKALPQKTDEQKSERKRKSSRPAAPYKPDGSYVWTPQKSEPASFEEMMNQFKARSDEKFSDLKRKKNESRRPRRGAMK